MQEHLSQSGLTQAAVHWGKMAAPLPLPRITEIGRRRFRFYPPIANVELNEWQLRWADACELRVQNVNSGDAVSVDRQYVGAVLENDDLSLTVGLTKELEYWKGAIRPRNRQVIRMPLCGEALPAPLKLTPRTHNGEADVVAIRLDSCTQSRKNRIVASIGVIAVIISLLLLVLTRVLSISTRARAHSGEVKHRRTYGHAIGASSFHI